MQNTARSFLRIFPVFFTEFEFLNMLSSISSVMAHRPCGDIMIRRPAIFCSAYKMSNDRGSGRRPEARNWKEGRAAGQEVDF